jgi:hypothetical protein
MRHLLVILLETSDFIIGSYLCADYFSSECYCSLNIVTPGTSLCIPTPVFILISLIQALVDAPDMTRCQINFKRLSLTDIKIDIKRIPKKSTLIKAMADAGNVELLSALLLIILPATYSCSFFFSILIAVP